MNNFRAAMARSIAQSMNVEGHNLSEQDIYDADVHGLLEECAVLAAGDRVAPDYYDKLRGLIDALPELSDAEFEIEPFI